MIDVLIKPIIGVDNRPTYKVQESNIVDTRELDQKHRRRERKKVGTSKPAAVA